MLHHVLQNNLTQEHAYPLSDNTSKHPNASVKAAVNKRIRINVEQRSRVLVRLHDPVAPALLVPHLVRPLQRHLGPLLRQSHRQRRPPPEDEVRLVVSLPLMRNLTESF